MSGEKYKGQSGSPTGAVLEQPRIETLKANLRGELLQPAEEGYEAARKVYNAMIDRHPRLIVRCADVVDVSSAVRFAREHQLTISIRGGGHNVAGFAVNDDGLVIDLSRMRGVRIDLAARTVRAEGGCTWGDLDHATCPFGFAVPGGIVSTTGIAGLTLGGSVGNLTRPYSEAGTYVNFLGDEGEDRIKQTYRENYVRLLALENKYDPTNLFHMNQNIRPMM